MECSYLLDSEPRIEKPSRDLPFERCVKHALKEVMGESAANAVLYHVGKENLEKPEKLAKALREIFGSGAFGLEEHIVKVLYEELGLCFKKKGYTFMQYVQEAEKLAHPQKLG